ncbi:MAG: recombinase RecT [Acidimicrobiales bacterium]
MSVRQAVEKRQAAPKDLTPAQYARRIIDAQKPGFQAVLPAQVDIDRWARLTMSAVKASPELVQAFGTEQGQMSVLLAAMQCATVGLEPNTALQEAWILPRKNKGVLEGQLQIGYRGLLKLARQSGEIETVFAQVVREGDTFTWGRDLDRDHLSHTPDPDGDEDRPITHAYAIVRYRNGGRDFEVMPWKAIEKHRAMSDSWRNEKARPYSPWTKWTADMAAKTVLKKLAKRMPMSAQAEMAIASDEAELRLNSDDGVIDVSDSFDAAPLGELSAGDADTGPPAGVTADGEVVDEPESAVGADSAGSDGAEDPPPPAADPTPDDDSGEPEQQAMVDDDPIEATADETPAPDPAEEPAGRHRLARLTAFLRGAGIEGADRIAWANEHLDHQVTAWSSEQLSRADVELLLTAFEPDDTEDQEG